MSDEKKYYWIKLQKDFFKRHDILIVESMTNGKDYILFYLKLLVESVTHVGHLRFSDTIPFTVEMLATITNTNVDIVRSAIKIFEELKMMEVLDDQTIYMIEVEKMVGSETVWAEKKRLYRDKQGQCPQLVHGLSDKSKSIDLELDKEIDIEARPVDNFKSGEDAWLEIATKVGNTTKVPVYSNQLIHTAVQKCGGSFAIAQSSPGSLKQKFINEYTRLMGTTH